MSKPKGESQNIYATSKFSKEETSRLEKFSYPFKVSTEVIGTKIAGKTIVDLGAGSNTQLAKWIPEQKGKYIAVDIVPLYLIKQSQIPSTRIVKGDITNLQINKLTADISHTRFVLGHLIDIRKRSKAIKNAINVAKERAIFLEFDWAPMLNDPRLTGIAKHFVTLSQDCFPQMPFDPLYGQRLPNEIDEIAKGQGYEVKKRRFKRPRGNYEEELISLADSLAGMMENRHSAALAKALTSLSTELKNSKDIRIANLEFTPADIVCTEINKPPTPPIILPNTNSQKI